jgi:hypothetical protein
LLLQLLSLVLNNPISIWESDKMDLARNSMESSKRRIMDANMGQESFHFPRTNVLVQALPQWSEGKPTKRNCSVHNGESLGQISRTNSSIFAFAENFSDGVIGIGFDRVGKTQPHPLISVVSLHAVFCQKQTTWCK